MAKEPESVNVVLQFQDVKAEFNGLPEVALQFVNSFFMKHIPNISLANKISVNYSVSELIEMFGNLVKITPEGPRVWHGEQKLSDKDVVTLQLVVAKIGSLTGKSKSPSLSLSDIQSSTGVNPKSVSSRLSELVKSGHVERESSDNGVKYRITTQGIAWLKSALAKRLKKS